MKMPKMELLMRRLMGVFCVMLLPLVTSGVRVADLPVGEYADTEVETNLPFRVSLDEMSRAEVSLSLVATPTNVVEVSSVAARSRRPSASKSSVASPA